MNRVWIYLGIGAAATAALIFWLSGERPGSLDDRDSQIGLVHSLLLLVLVGSALLVRRHLPSGMEVLRNGIIWIVIGLVLVLGYSYRDSFSRSWNRVVAELMPGHAVRTGDGEVLIRAQGKHFVVDAMVDGTQIPLLLDTGATDVTLSRRDARRIGIDVGRLNFSQVTRTANGLGRAAPIRLREIRIGDIIVRDVQASVNDAPLGVSLLGNSFLEKLSHYSVNGSLLTLRQ